MDNLLLKILLALLCGGAVYLFIWLRWKEVLGKRRMRLLSLAILIVAAVAWSIVGEMPEATETVTVTALREKNEMASRDDLYLTGVFLEGKRIQAALDTETSWYWKDEWLIWKEQGEDGKTESSPELDRLILHLPQGSGRSVEFFTNKAKGKVEVRSEGMTAVVDCYSLEDGRSRLDIPDTPDSARWQQTALRCVLFTAIFFAICGAAALILYEGRHLSRRVGNAISEKKEKRSWVTEKLIQLKKHQFLFEELVKRDFKKKYKRTVLGMVWSVLSPMLMLLVMRLVFTQFFGRNSTHYTTYLFCGNLVFSYFSESTREGMRSLMDNAKIFTKVTIPKYLFLISKNVQTLLNFGLTLCVFFLFCVFDRIHFTWRLVLLLYPISLLVLFNLGMGLILSALYVFFRDIQYLWTIFTQLLMYMSAIFYTIDHYSYTVQCLFLLNPVYLFIRYFRKIVIEAAIPSVWFHLLMLADVAVVFILGCLMYKKNNTKFLYYL